jgi:hypothetical protein
MAARILNYNIFVDLTAHINQWKNVFLVFDFFLNVSQLSLTFLILFQNLLNAVRYGDVDLVQDCLHKGADLHYEDDHVSSIYTM